MFEISRRDLVLSAAGAYAAFGLAKPIAFIGAAEAQTIPAEAGFKKYKVGDIEVIALFDGDWERPHDENFIKGVNVEQTKAALKAAGLPDAYMPIPFTVIAVNTGGRLVLIDSGTGGGQRAGRRRANWRKAWRLPASTPRTSRRSWSRISIPTTSSA
jgi:hypothetical protein